MSEQTSTKTTELYAHVTERNLAAIRSPLNEITEADGVGMGIDDGSSESEPGGRQLREGDRDGTTP